MSLPTQRLVLAAAVVAGSIFSAGDAGAQSERRTLGGSSIAVYNIVGNVIVESGSGSEVVVEVTRRGRDAGKLRLAVGELRGRNTLRVLYPDDDIVYDDDRSRASNGRRWGNSSTELRVDDDGTWGHGDRRWNDGRRVRVRSNGDGTEAWADLRITVPAGKTLDVNLGVGTMEANGVSADLRLDVAAASVKASGTRGRLDIDAGSGSVDVRDANASNGLSIDTGSGSVTVSGITGGTCSVDTGSGGITGERLTCESLNIDVGSGTVRLEDVRSPSASIESGSGGVRVNMLSAPRNLRVETGSGSVTIGLPENVGAEVDIDTGSGGISTDFPLSTNRFDRRHLRGRIGNGSGRITVETGSGSVRLLRNDSR